MRDPLNQAITDDDCRNSAAVPHPVTAEPMQPANATLHFNTSDTLDRALYGLVKLIRAEALPPVIERKAEKIALLERLESNDTFSGNTRSLLSYIRQDLAQLEETGEY